MAKISKGMPIEIGIKRLSLLKEKGLIKEEIFSDAEELLSKSEIDISSKKLNILILSAFNSIL